HRLKYTVSRKGQEIRGRRILQGPKGVGTSRSFLAYPTALVFADERTSSPVEVLPPNHRYEIQVSPKIHFYGLPTTRQLGDLFKSVGLSKSSRITFAN